jgi:hypothetical protein
MWEENYGKINGSCYMQVIYNSSISCFHLSVISQNLFQYSTTGSASTLYNLNCVISLPFKVFVMVIVFTDIIHFTVYIFIVFK